MTVHFVYRCGYLGPTCLHRRTFTEDQTVLDWFRRNWPGNLDEEDASELGERLLGIHVAYFDAVLATISQERAPLPRTMEEVASAIQGGYNQAVCFEDHCLQALTDDDEIDMAYYFFDDVFLGEQGDLAAYILHEWRLPDGEGNGWSPGESTSSMLKEGQGPGKGCLYTASLDLHAGEHLGDGFTSQNLQGVRVPDLSRWLMSSDIRDGEDWPLYFERLRAVLLSEDLASNEEEGAFVRAIQEHPEDDLTWSAYADWTQEHGHRLPGLRLLERALSRLGSTDDAGETRNLVQVGDHIVQLFAHVGGDDFDQWFVFDDLWGGAQPALADALLKYTRWDFLSTGNETRWE